MRVVTIAAVILAVLLSILIFSVATASFTGGLPQTDLLYVTSTQDWVDETATPSLATLQDGVLNEISWSLIEGTPQLYTFMQADGSTIASEGVITPDETINFNSYWVTGSRVREAYITFKLHVDGVLVCQDGDDNTAGSLITDSFSGIVSGSCSPTEDFEITSSSTVRYTATLWAEDIQGGGGPNGDLDRIASLQWDTATADTWIEINSIMPSEVTLSTDQASYQETQTVTANGTYTWMNGTAIDNADVTVRFYDSTDTLQQETTVQTDVNGDYQETYTLPEGSALGAWTVNVTAEYDAEISATNQTTFEVEELVERTINVSTLEASYEQEETATAQGVFSWDNGTAIAGANVTVSWISPSSSVEQETNVTTNSLGEYTETYTLPSGAEVGVWTVNVTGHDDGTTTTNQTTFEVTELVAPERTINVSTLEASYEQEETATAQGVFSWDNGTAIAGANVTVVWVDPSSSVQQEANVTTNSTGGYSETYVLPADAEVGVWTVNVTGHDDGTTTTNQTTFEVTEFVERTITVSTNATYVQGDTATAQGVFSWSNGTAITGVNVTVLWINPSSALRQERNVTTNATGGYTETYDIPIDAQTGEWTVHVTGHDAGTTTTNQTTFTLEADTTDELTVATDQASYEQEDTATGFGTYTWSNGTAISDENITVRWVSPSSSLEQETNVTTNSTGGYSETYSIPAGAEVGTWTLEVVGYANGTTTNQTTFEVTELVEPEPTITVSTDTNYIQNDTATAQGVFSWDNGTAIAGAEVTVTWISPSSSVEQTRNVTTNSLGEYTETFDTTGGELGEWRINVSGWLDGSIQSQGTTTFELLDEPPAIPEGACIGVYVEKGPDWEDGLIQKGDVFEYVCNLPSALKRNQELRIDVIFPNARLAKALFAPRVLLEEEVLYP